MILLTLPDAILNEWTYLAGGGDVFSIRGEVDQLANLDPIRGEVSLHPQLAKLFQA